MNTLKLENQRNFPLTTDALKFMQDAYASLEQLALLAGTHAIISGCTVTGQSASDGVVVIHGKLMPMRGGTIQSNVRIVTTTGTVQVGTGVREQTTYHAEFGTSVNPSEMVAWSQLNSSRAQGTVGLKSIIDNKVDKVAGQRLMTDAEGSKLAGIDGSINSLLAGKVDKEAGNRLITATEISKLAGIAEGANNYVHPSNPAHQIGEIEGLEPFLQVSEDYVIPFNGFSVPDNSYFFIVRKVGKVATLFFRIRKDNPTVGIRLGRISEAFRPSRSVRFVVFSSNNMSPGGILSDGFIESGNTETNTTLSGTATWIIQ